MVRNFYYLTALMAALTTLVAVIAHSQTLPAPTGAIAPQLIDNQRDRATVPVCYIQLQNGQMRDLRRLCGKTASPLPVRRTQNNPQRPNVQGSSDSEEEMTPVASPALRRVPSQVTPGASATPQPTLTQPSLQPAQPLLQPTNSPNAGIGAPDRPANTPSPISPLTSPPSTSQPLAIPADDSR